MSPGKVQHICSTAHLKNARKKDIVRKLFKEHTDFLLSPQTLIQWAGFTMKERVVLFHRMFPNKRISATSLHRLYKANGVTMKSVKINKSTPPPNLHNYEEQRIRTLGKLERATEQHLPVVYLDELIFSKRTIQSKALSLRNQHIKVDQNNLYIGYLAVIAAV